VKKAGEKSGGEWHKESASFMTKPRQTSRQKKEDSRVLRPGDL